MGTNQKVRCYGCGHEYDALNVETSHRHTHHLRVERFDRGATRDTVAAWLDMCQRERDEALRLAREPSRGTTEPSETAASATQTLPADMDGQLRQLADLDAQWRAVRDGLARIHRERVEVLRVMRATLSVAQIAGLLGVSRQQVHKLLRD